MRRIFFPLCLSDIALSHLQTAIKLNYVYFKIQFVESSKHIPSRLEKPISSVLGNNRYFSEIHTKYINTLCGQKVESVNYKTGGTYSDHWALKCLMCIVAFRG